VFLRVAPLRALALVGSFLVGPGADLFVSRPQTFWLAVGFGVVTLPCLWWLVRRILRALPAEQGRHLPWLGVGALLSLVPSLGGFPGSRILFLPSVGGVAVIAVVLAHAWAARKTSRAWRYAAPVLMAAELLRPIALNLGSVAVYRTLWQQSEHFARDSELPASATDRVVVLATSDLIAAVYTDTVRMAVTGRAAQGAWWILSMAPHAHRVRRLTPTTLELEVVDGRMLDGLYEGLWRDAEAQPFHIGDRVVLDGMQVTVAAVDQGHPTRLSASFDRPLDDPTLWFVAYRDGKLRRLSLPSDGSWLALVRERGPLEP